MIYLYWYLGVGAAVLAIVFGAHRLTKEHESESIREILDAVNPERKKLSYRILNNFVGPVLAAVAIVVVVIFLFLRRLSATIIPSIAIPLSIVATFAVMYLLDYSLNNLSLMALKKLRVKIGERELFDSIFHRQFSGDPAGANILPEAHAQRMNTGDCATGCMPV